MRSLWLFLLVAGKRRRSGTVGQAALAVCNLKCVPNAPVRSLVFLHTAGNSADGAVWWPTHYTKLLRLAIRFRLWGFPSFDFHLMCWLLFEMAFAINSRQQRNLVLWREWGFDFLKKINSTSGFFSDCNLVLWDCRIKRSRGKTKSEKECFIRRDLCLLSFFLMPKIGNQDSLELEIVTGNSLKKCETGDYNSSACVLNYQKGYCKPLFNSSN